MKNIFKRVSAVIGAIAGSAGAMASQEAAAHRPEVKELPLLGNLASVIKPLFSGEVPRFFAGHRSHSSHGSHGSHRSSAGGGYVAPTPAPVYPSTPPPRPAVPPSNLQSDPLGQPAKPSSTFRPATPDSPRLANDPARRASVIRRLQLALKLENLYNGPIDGVLGPETRDAIDLYKIKKGAPRGGYLDAATLNLFGVTID